MSMTEAETRQQLIDENLRLAGWNVNDTSQVRQELDIDLAQAGIIRESSNGYTGHRFSDYGLLLHGEPIAVVEAKKTSKHAALGKEQALQYAQNLERIHGVLPFVLYTNGYDIYFWESDFYPPVKMHGFPTREDLEWMRQRREQRQSLSTEAINTNIVDRDYQIAAIRAILENLQVKRRKALLVMATGTGKTRATVALIDLLIRARWARKVLFLVDRVALQEQALFAFEEHLPSEPRWPQQGEKAFQRNRRVYVTTYPTMLNLIQNGTTPSTYISPHFFDLVVADESHRSIYNIYKQVLEYFNAIKLGLTATPKDHIDHDTFKLFNCETGVPTFAYTFEEAVNHDPPYLCDFEVLKVRSKFQIEGIKGGQLPPAEQKQLIAEGKDIKDIDFEGTELERKVTNAGTNALILREFMEECIKDSSGTVPGKSIIFAITKDHARRLQELFDKMYPEYAGKLARVLVSEDRYVYGKGGLLDQFKNQDMPRVAISVDMLDTGVDIREVVNLVFAKPVYSFTKFWQMIGRGTRVLDLAKRKPWCPQKDKFLIIDCWENFEFFEMTPKGREPNQQVPLPVRLFNARMDKLDAALAHGRNDIADAVKTELRRDIAALPKSNVVISEKQAALAKVAADGFWKHLKQADIEYLRTEISLLFRARGEIDLKATRFEIEAVELGTARITNNEAAIEALKESIRVQVAELPPTVNVVAKEQELIDAVGGRRWWETMTDDDIHALIERLAPLMRYRQARSTPMMELDIADLVAVKEWIEVGPDRARIPVEAYREQVEAYIRQLVDENAALRKIQAGESVSDAEVIELANLLQSQAPYITEDLLRQVYHHKTARFVQFIRHILNLGELEDWSVTVTRAFDAFIAEHNTFSALQIRFLQTLRTFILQNRVVEKRDLIAPPFTQIHPDGIRGVFGPQEINEILEFAEKFAA